MLYALPNLVSSSVTPCEPWTFQGVIPAEVRGKEGKKARDSWRTDPNTQHNIYTGWEGLNENLRISDGRNKLQENPPMRLHALVADIDCAITDEELAQGLARIPFLPAWFCRSLSGQLHLVWLLEKPLTIPASIEFAKSLLVLIAVRIKADSIGPRFDLAAFTDPRRYYTNGCDWYKIEGSEPIPESLVRGWMIETAETHNFRRDRHALAIPLPVVWDELQKKYPQHGWEGEFVEGAQGPSFWIPQSQSTKSAVVKATGMFTFSGSAAKPFYSWADLLGIDWVKNYETEILGKAVKDIYFDGQVYYRHNGYQAWKAFTKEDLSSHLVVSKGLSPRAEDGRPSEVARALEFVRDWQAVDGAAPFVFQPPGLLNRNGHRVLNTHVRRPLPPATRSVAWGDGFPVLAQFFERFFSSDDQLPFFLAWLHRFYRGACDLNLESGQNIFILGPAGVGKTFLSQGVLPRLLNGAADAEDYLLGKTQFNSELFECGLWTVDDNSATVDTATHRKFTSIVKKMAANTTFQYHAKFRVPVTVDWLGRVLVTANDDAESSRIVPDLSQTILDKLMLFRAAPSAPIAFRSRKEMLNILRDELPYFARYLYDYTIPSHCQSTARFGITAYHEPAILRSAQQSSPTAAFSEVVDHWRKEYFHENPTLVEWRGTAYEFTMLLLRDEARSRAIGSRFGPQSVGRELASLQAGGRNYLSYFTDPDTLNRVWVISK